MKRQVNRLVKLKRSVSLSPKHYNIIMEMAEKSGCVNLLPPKSGEPNLAVLLESIAEGRLKLVDSETEKEILRDAKMSADLARALAKDRETNVLSQETRLTSKRFLLNQAIKNIKRANKTNKRTTESN